MMGFKTSLLFVLLLSSVEIYAGETYSFIKPQLSISEGKSHLVLDGNLEFSFSQAAMEALDNGLPLTVTSEVSIVDPEKWFWNNVVWRKSFSHQIHYHALSNQYLVKNMQSDYPTASLSSVTAVRALGSINNFKLVETSILGLATRYELQIKTSLDISSLPTPLRPLAYLSEEWRLQSQWQTWRKR